MHWYPEAVKQVEQEVRGEQFCETGGREGEGIELYHRGLEETILGDMFQVGLLFLPPPSLLEARNP